MVAYEKVTYFLESNGTVKSITVLNPYLVTWRGIFLNMTSTSILLPSMSMVNLSMQAWLACHLCGSNITSKSLLARIVFRRVSSWHA